MFTGELETRMHALDSALEALAAYASNRVAESEAVAQIARRATQIRDDVATVAEGGRGKNVTWTEVRGRRASIGASPVDVSTLLREELFYKTRSVVLTSATLATGGSFEFIARRLGIDFAVDEAILESPFEWDAQAALYVASHLPDPREPAYLAAAAQEVCELVDVTGGGAFVLCTSFRVMGELARRATPLIDGPVLVQGEAPKNALLARFREAGDAVLFATSSFWEGVDVPGRALRLVVIDKLPFDVPSDPLVEARCARMTEAGEQPFMKYLVPSAALALKQGFGRLVRTRRDHGIVAILDRRLVTKGYGRVFLKSLPPARRCETLEEVRSFWEGVA
jgi:ATP-dependent DNA helicase DinG